MPAGWKLIVGAEGLGTGPSRDGFAAGGLGAPVGCVYARLTGAGLGRSGADAECKRDVPPCVEVRCGGRLVQDNAADRADDVRPQCEEPVAQPRHTGAGTGGARRAQPEFLQEHVGGGGEVHAQLIGPEATATRAVDLQAIEQLLDPILDVAADAVDPFIEEARRLAQGGHDEARVVARVAVAEPDDLGLDHTAVTVPRAGPMAGVGVDMRGLAAGRALDLRHEQGGLSVALQPGVLGHRHHVVEPRLGIQEVEDLRHRKTPVEPDEKPRLGKGLPQQGQQPTQHAHGPAGGRHISGPQHRRAQILFAFLVEGLKRQQQQVAPAIVVPVEEGALQGVSPVTQ